MGLKPFVLAAVTLAAACSQGSPAPEAAEEYWRLPPLELPDGAPIEGVHYVNAASIQEYDGARTVFIVAFSRGLVNQTRA